MKTLKIVLFLLISTSLFSQEFKLQKSEIFKDSKKQSALSFSLEDDNGNLVVIRTFYGGMFKMPKGYYIQTFDKNLKLMNEMEMDIDDNTLKNAVIIDNQLHLIELNVDKKKDNIEFNVLSSDLKSLDFKKKNIISFSEDDAQKYFGVAIAPFMISNFSQMDSNHLGEVVFSENDNFFAINFDVNDKDKETHKVFVFDKNFNQLYNQTIQKDIKDKLFEYNSIDIDDEDGTVYFLGKSYQNNSKRSKKKGKTNYFFELYKVNAEGQQKQTFKYDDKLIESLQLFKSNGNVSAVGFYGKKDESRINGVCLISLNPEDLSILGQKFTPFSETFLTDKYGNKDGKKEKSKKKGIRNIDFKSVYSLSDGGMILNAEEFYITTYTTTSSNGSMTTRTVYHFDDIMSIKVDKSGNLVWSRNINKRQTGFSNSSFTSIPVGDKNHFFINCSDNIKTSKNGNLYFRQTKSKKSNLYAITIDEQGKVSYKKLIDDKESKVFYKVNNGIPNLSDDTMILLGKRKKNTRILKVQI